MNPDEILERAQVDTFWLPPDATVVDRDDVTYISCPRPVDYLNTVPRTRRERGVAQLIDEVAAAHAGRPSRWLVCPQSRPVDLERHLDDAGYQPTELHHAYVLPTDRDPPTRPGVVTRRVASRETLLDAIGVSERAFARSLHTTEEELARELARLVDPASRASRWVAYVDGVPAASGGLTTFPALGFGLLWAGGTAPEARGRGAYGALISARLIEARRRGLGLVGLYARDETSGPIVAARGFERHGPMVYWQR